MKFKKMTSVLLAAALLLLCSCAARQPEPPQQQAEPDAQTQAPIPEPQKPPVTPEAPKAPEKPEPAQPDQTAESLSALREIMEPSDAIAAILYLGCWDRGPLNSDFFATLDPQLYLEKYAFLSQLPPSRLIAGDGYEIYCIIPADPDASVLVTQWQEPEENDYAPGPGAVLYEAADGQPFLLQANVSDILPNVAVTITDSRGRVLQQYQPQISLRDGTVVLPGGEQPVVLDFTEYPPPAQEEGPVMTDYLLCVPNAAADGFDFLPLEEQLVGPTYLLPLLVEYGVLPDDLVFNSFSQEGADLYLDLGAGFGDYLRTMGSTGELLILGSVVNSFLSAYGADTITITVDGGLLETGHNLYDAPFTYMSMQG